MIIALTRQNTIDKAWDELFRTFNYKKGKGAVKYKKGEKIAIKINLNDMVELISLMLLHSQYILCCINWWIS